MHNIHRHRNPMATTYSIPNLIMTNVCDQSNCNEKTTQRTNSIITSPQHTNSRNNNTSTNTMLSMYSNSYRNKPHYCVLRMYFEVCNHHHYHRHGYHRLLLHQQNQKSNRQRRQFLTECWCVIWRSGQWSATEYGFEHKNEEAEVDSTTHDGGHSTFK